MTLVLDLDETLVHSEMVPTSTPNTIFKIRLNDILYNIYVYYRPGLLSFLNSVCNIYEVVIFTASMKPYAEQVLKALDPYNRLKYRFYRDCCTEMNGNYIKDLRVLGRDLSQVIIIDNSEIAFSFQPENGILIKSWFSDQTDRELDSIQSFLMSLSECEDVRPALRKNCSLNTKIDLII
jgi:CTD small phosphatase-like protein 2